MSDKKNPWMMRAYVIAFVVLTSLCWCPWAYGQLTGRALSIPVWGVLAFVFAAALFVLEWVFLFLSGLAVGDEEMTSIISDLEGVDTDASAKEGE